MQVDTLQRLRKAQRNCPLYLQQELKIKEFAKSGTLQKYLGTLGSRGEQRGAKLGFHLFAISQLPLKGLQDAVTEGFSGSSREGGRDGEGGIN